MRPQRNAEPGRTRVPMLDVARFVAAVTVLLYHFAFHGGVTGKYLDMYSPRLGAWTQYGYLGVNVFFVISGFVIAWTAEGSTVARFAWSRWLRVYPTFVVCVLLSASAVALAQDPHFHVRWAQLLAHLVVDARRVGYDFIDGVYWTIVCELLFYAWVAVGLSVPWLRRRANACLALWLLVSAANELWWHEAALGYLLLTKFSGLFIVGMLLYRLHRGRFSPANVVLFVAALGYAVAMEVQLAVARFGDLGVAFSPSIVVGVLLVSVLLLGWSARWRFSDTSERRLQRVGGLTYPLYLLHATIGFILINRLAPAVGLLAALVVTTLLMFLLSAVVARWIEPYVKKQVTAFARSLLRILMPDRTGVSTP